LGASISLPLNLSQHAEEHRPERPVLLAVDQQIGEGAALRVAPELADPVAGSPSARPPTGSASHPRRLPGVGVVLLADLDEVDGPREPGLVGVRRIAADDGHAPRGIHPALGLVVYVLAAHRRSLPHRRSFFLRNSALADAQTGQSSVV
jgi:hypothetical protein